MPTRWTDADRARFLVALADHGGVVNAAAKASGIPTGTARGWAKRAAAARVAIQDGQPQKGGTPTDASWHERFIERLAVTGNVTKAAAAAGVSRSAAYVHRDVDPEFKAAWEEADAMVADELEDEARRRAVEGDEVTIFNRRGEEIGTTFKRSDTLLIFLLKGARPDKYRENMRHEHSGPGGGPISYKVYEGTSPDDL